MSKATMCGIKDCTERVPVKHAQTPLMCGNQSCDELHSWVNKLPESDLRVSVARLREILMDRADLRGILREWPVDEIINRVKEEI